MDLRHWTFHHRVLDPLVQFGLLERRLLPAANKLDKLREFRVTPPYGRFIRVAFDSALPFLVMRPL
jgi:hypothetical protein